MIFHHMYSSNSLVLTLFVTLYTIFRNAQLQKTILTSVYYGVHVMSLYELLSISCLRSDRSGRRCQISCSSIGKPLITNCLVLVIGIWPRYFRFRYLHIDLIFNSSFEIVDYWIYIVSNVNILIMLEKNQNIYFQYIH